MPCPEWAWCHILCTPATQFHNMYTRLIPLRWDTPEAPHGHRTHETLFFSFLRHILPLPRLPFFAFLRVRVFFFYHVAHHIPRRPVSFLIPRGTYTYLLPPNWHFIFYIFTSSSYTVAGLLCSWSLAGARVFGWLFFPIVSCLFLFYHGIVPPFHSPSISSGSFSDPVCFCVFFSISFGGISSPVVCAGTFHGWWLSGLECHFTSYVGAFLWVTLIDFFFLIPLYSHRRYMCYFVNT